jgi:hypothetical protein
MAKKKRFKSHEELKEVYDKGKYNIFYKHGDTMYTVANIGSTIYCRNAEKGMGMGAIYNFPIEHFYGEEKPVPVDIEDGEENATNDGLD